MEPGLSGAVPGRRETDPPLDERARRTFRHDRVRGACSGVLETGWQTFALLVAVRVFDASPNAKALLVAANPLGLILTPVSLFVAARLGIPAARGCSFYLAFAALTLAAGTIAPGAGLFVLAMVLGSMAAAQQGPLMVNIYSENYPPARRGRLLSQSIILGVAASALFGWGGGLLLDRDLDWYPALFAGMAVAAAVAAVALRGIPSTAAAPPPGRNPLHSLSHAWRDPVFGWMLVVWMLMGLGNLLIIPLRVEYLANPVFGINASNREVALVVAIVPALVRMLTTHLWGWLFDRYNFFVIRTVINGLFLAAILLFFHTDRLALLLIAGGIFGLALAGGNIAWSLWVTKFAPPAQVPAYMSVHTFLTGIRGVLAPFLGFHLVTGASPQLAAWIAAALIALSMLLLGPVRQRAEAKLGPDGPGLSG